MHVDEGGALTGAMSEYNTIKDNIAQKKIDESLQL